MGPVRVDRESRHRGASPAWGVALGLALVASLAPPASGQAPPGQPVVRAGTAAVLLDVVIRDKKGRPVPDVAAAEVEVFEDGVKQKIEAFRWVQTEPASVEVTTPAPAGVDARRTPNLVSLVFDQLGPDGRRLAAKAANAFLERGLGPNTWVAVFQIDQRLMLLQPFTNERAPGPFMLK